MPIYEYKCHDCGRIFELLVRGEVQAEAARCKHCASGQLKRLISSPGLVRSKNSGEAGQLRPVDPRRAMEHMSRTYDQIGVDPGKGFEEVAKRAAAGDSPRDLKEAVKEARKAQKQKKDTA